MNYLVQSHIDQDWQTFCSASTFDEAQEYVKPGDRIVPDEPFPPPQIPRGTAMTVRHNAIIFVAVGCGALVLVWGLASIFRALRAWL